jgi:Flp pilus assembly protein TadG
MGWVKRHHQRLSEALRRFTRGDSGAAAVELAFVALPFFALLIGIFEIGMIFLIATTLENATDKAARQIRTGSLENQSETQAQFRTLICSQLTWLGNQCASNLLVEVQTYADFAAVTTTNPVTNKTLQAQSQLPFSMGGPGDIVLVQAYYPWTLMAPLLDGMTAQTSGGQTLITATTVFRNEPYPTTP